MHISMTAEVAPGNSPRPSILRSAEIIASGSFVSSTEPASASSSRERDRAKRTTSDRPHARPIRAIARSTMANAPPPFLSPSDEEDDDRPPPPKLQLELKKMRKNSSAKKPITPAMTTAITSNCTSPLRIWVSSCPSTASISRSLSALISPVVTLIAYWLRLRPVAKALSAGLSTILSFGIGMPREMQRFSRRL